MGFFAVLELEQEREALEFLPESEGADVAEEEDPTPSGPSFHEVGRRGHT